MTVSLPYIMAFITPMQARLLDVEHLPLALLQNAIFKSISPHSLIYTNKNNGTFTEWWKFSYLCTSIKEIYKKIITPYICFVKLFTSYYCTKLIHPLCHAKVLLIKECKKGMKHLHSNKCFTPF